MDIVLKTKALEMQAFLKALEPTLEAEATLRQALVLLELSTGGEANNAALARSLGLSKPVVCRVIQGFTKKGLVETRDHEEDRRCTLHRLTEEGILVLEAALGSSVGPD